MGGKYSPCLKWYITVSYVSNVNGLKKHTQRLSTVQHSAPSPSCPRQISLLSTTALVLQPCKVPAFSKRSANEQNFQRSNYRI